MAISSATTTTLQSEQPYPIHLSAAVKMPISTHENGSQMFSTKATNGNFKVETSLNSSLITGSNNNPNKRTSLKLANFNELGELQRNWRTSTKLANFNELDEIH